MEELRTVNAKEITNKELKGYTNKIKSCGDNIRKNYIKISFLLNEIDESECYLDDGFSDVQEYASKVLNIQKTTCYNLLKIGKEFINPEGTRTVLTESGNDYGVSQLQVLLTVGVDKAKELHNNETISPDMSVRQLKAILKGDEPEDDEDNAIDTDSEEISSEDMGTVGIATLLDDGSILWNLPDGYEDFIEKVNKLYKKAFENNEE